MGVVRVQGMCPHEFYLGTCIFGPKKIGQGGVLREGGLGTYTSPTLII